eukprot:TRINITY_DN86_c0_g1_i10.p2 TRINITY_DN86_c0_g1~~TRINITY_DN86_c0_g1_i10.p2  ORF type:complete len:124 (-),score=17.79 TRINITY_DN86_c0_g1_i10:1057-1428(-)
MMMMMKTTRSSTSVSYKIIWTLLVLILLLADYAAAKTESHPQTRGMHLTRHHDSLPQKVRGRALDGSDSNSDSDSDNSSGSDSSSDEDEDEAPDSASGSVAPDGPESSSPPPPVIDPEAPGSP